MDVINRQADNQLHPETFQVTYQKVPFPDFAKIKRIQTLKKFLRELNIDIQVCDIDLWGLQQMMSITLLKSVKNC